jgi:hypothetical protein
MKVKVERSTRLVHTVFRGELEHLKIETRLIDDRFPNVIDETHNSYLPSHNRHLPSHNCYV